MRSIVRIYFLDPTGNRKTEQNETQESRTASRGRGMVRATASNISVTESVLAVPSRVTIRDFWFGERKNP